MTAQFRQVRLSGFGGQGVVLAGTILGHAAVKDGRWAAGSSSYGAQARGGTARSDVVISDRPIAFPHVLEADILLALSQTAYDRYTEELTRESWVFYDDEMVAPRMLKHASQIGIPATSSSVKEFGNPQPANMVILGASAVLTNIVTKEALIGSIVENVSRRYREVNLRALELGYGLGERRRDGR